MPIYLQANVQTILDNHPVDGRVGDGRSFFLSTEGKITGLIEVSVQTPKAHDSLAQVVLTTDELNFVSTVQGPINDVPQPVKSDGKIVDLNLSLQGRFVILIVIKRVISSM